MEEVDPNAEATAGDVAGAVLAAAKKTIISQVVKKNVIENIIPIVIALKVSEFWLLVVQILLQKSSFFPKGHSIQTLNFPLLNYL
jgi:hypothetical protein